MKKSNYNYYSEGQEFVEPLKSQSRIIILGEIQWNRKEAITKEAITRKKSAY